MMQGKCLEKDMDSHSFKISGCFCGDKTLPSLNQYLAEIGRNPKAGGRLKNQYLIIITNAIRRDLGRFSTDSPVILHYTFAEPNRGQKRDYSNIFSGAAKFIEDALVRCNVIPDDNPKYVVNFTHDFVYTDGEPYISVEIEEVEIEETGRVVN